MSLDLKRQLVAQLVESSRLLRNYIDHRAKGRGTTRAQWIVLFRLRQQEGLSQVDLADVLELQPISLVRLLDRLVEHGLLERRPDPRDRRANRLFLTPAASWSTISTACATHATDSAKIPPRQSKPASRRPDIKERIKGFAEPPAAPCRSPSCSKSGMFAPETYVACAFSTQSPAAPGRRSSISRRAYETGKQFKSA
jgi:hypothetical protein